MTALLDLTFPTPAANLACDDALLDQCDAGDGPEALRFWEPHEYFVVVGYSNRVESEVNAAACRQRGIPILRRCTGGGTVLQGPGCLNYSLILRIDSDPALQTVMDTNRFVLERNRAALQTLLGAAPPLKSQFAIRNSQISVRGHTDLVIGDRKFSGNAQRRKRHAVLFHGTFLIGFDLKLVAELLPLPSKQPAYRRSRSHEKFLVNLNDASADEIKAALQQAWAATETPNELPSAATSELVAQKYSLDAWNLKR